MSLKDFFGKMFGPSEETLAFSLLERAPQNVDYLIIEDRLEAIKKALALAREGDLVLLAGKGHENEQIVKNKSLPFNDKEVVKGLLMV